MPARQPVHFDPLAATDAELRARKAELERWLSHHIEYSASVESEMTAIEREIERRAKSAIRPIDESVLDQLSMQDLVLTMREQVRIARGEATLAQIIDERRECEAHDALHLDRAALVAAELDIY